MAENDRLEKEVRDFLAGLATEASAVPTVPGKLGRRATLRRARTATALAVTVALLGYGALAGARAIRGVPGPAVRSATQTPTRLPQAAQLVNAYDVLPAIMTAGGGQLYGISISPSGSRATFFRIDPAGTVTRQVSSDALAAYFRVLTDQGQSLYVGTSVIWRFTSASNELIRLDASTLTVKARTTLPGGVVALASGDHDLWVALSDRVLRLDPVSLAVRATCAIPGARPFPAGSSSISSLALGPGGLWASFGDARHTTLFRFDPTSLAVLGKVAVPESGQGITLVAGPQSVWLTGQDFIRPVDASGHLGAATRVPGLEAVAARGIGLLALVGSSDTQQTNLTQFNAAGDVVASSDVGGAGPASSRLVVDGADVWLLQGLSVTRWTLVSPAP